MRAPGAFLFAVPSVAPTSCSTSALCTDCWRDLSDDEVEAVALRVIQKIPGPRARFRRMKPLRHPLVAGPGCRTPQTLLLIDERAALLREAARFYPGLSQRETARLIRVALSRYQGARWQRERADLTCPVQHAGKLTAVLWKLLRVRDHHSGSRRSRIA